MKKRNILLLSVSVAFIIILLLSSFSFTPTPKYTIEFGINVYATISFYKNGKLIYHFSGLDPLTNLGLNLTFCKLTGITTNGYNSTTYNLNTTYISLGNYTSVMDSTTTTLTGEFIKVSGTIHAVVYNGFNITGSFSGFSGTNSSNCMGLSYENSNIGQNALFGYTTFGLVTGIDSTFVITAEIQVQGTTT